MDESCREILTRLETYLDRECSASTESAIQAHLQDCPPCLRHADFRRELRVLIAARCKDAAPTGLLERVQVSLLDPGDHPGDAPGDAPDPDTGSA
jgi:mycothiol system anti-sigma-R factor